MSEPSSYLRYLPLVVWQDDDPTGIVRDGARLVICDPGLPAPPSVNPVWPRLDPLRFDVVVHFVGADLPDDPNQRSLLLQRVMANIGDVVVEQSRAAHLYWAPITEAEPGETGRETTR
jgi:hypothetical protein